MKDTDGAVRVSLTLSEDAAQLELFDAAGRVRVLTAFADEGFGVFQLYDASGVIGATLGLDLTARWRRLLGLSAESRKELTGLPSHWKAAASEWSPAWPISRSTTTRLTASKPRQAEAEAGGKCSSGATGDIDANSGT